MPRRAVASRGTVRDVLVSLPEAGPPVSGGNALAGVGLFAALPDDARDQLAACARPRSYGAGAVVFDEGAPGDSLHVVLSGRLAVVKPSLDPRMTLERLESGAVFGEIAVLTGQQRSASVVAVETSGTLEIGGTDLHRVLDANPTAMRRTLGFLARSLTLAKEDVARHNSVLEARVHKRTEELRESQLELVRRLAGAAESRDDDTGTHILRMSHMCAELALDAGLSREESENVLHAASMHDVGKLAIPDRVLLKPGPLEAEEWALMQTHTTVGARLLAGSRSPVVRLAETIARTHHERWDGTGYPNGLRGEEIPLVARICAVCDVFDALMSSRPYKAAWPLERALEEIERLAGTHFDPRLARLFVERRPDLRAGG